MSAERMSQGIFAVAIGSVLAGIVGGFSTIVYPDNMGMLRTTRVGSRYSTLAAGLILIVLGGCIKFDMLLVLVPQPVVSAAATLLFGVVFMHGVQMLAKVDWDDRQFAAAELLPARLKVLEVLAVALLAALALGNVISTLAICGAGLCPENPGGYLIFNDSLSLTLLGETP